MARTMRGIIFRCGGCDGVQRVYLPDHPKREAEDLAGLMDGSSEMYIYKPGPESTIGKCVNCGAQFKADLFGYDADPEVLQ